MDFFKNPYDTRIKAIDDVLEKRFGEAKTAKDWQKRVEALQAEQKKFKEGGDDFSYYSKAIFDAKKKKAENMDDASLEEQLAKIKEFQDLRNEEDEGLMKKINAETDDKKKTELLGDRNKKLEYYEKKINEVEDKIKPKNEEEFDQKIRTVDERRAEKLRRVGVNDKGKMADVSYFDKQIADAQRELDKIEKLKEERPIQFVLESSLKELRTKRDLEIAKNIAPKPNAPDSGFDPAIGAFSSLVTDWRKLDSKKRDTPKQWGARRDELIKLTNRLGSILNKLSKETPAFALGIKKIGESISKVIAEQILLATDEIETASGANKNAVPASQTSPSQAPSGPSAGSTPTQQPTSAESSTPAPTSKQPTREGMLEGLMTKEEEMAEAQMRWSKSIQFLVGGLISQLQKQRGAETIIGALHGFEIAWDAIDSRKPKTGAEWIRRLDALRGLKMELLNAKERLQDMKIDVDYDAIDNEIADAEEFLTAAGKKATQS